MIEQLCKNNLYNIRTAICLKNRFANNYTNQVAYVHSDMVMANTYSRSEHRCEASTCLQMKHLNKKPVTCILVFAGNFIAQVVSDRVDPCKGDVGLGRKRKH